MRCSLSAGADFVNGSSFASLTPCAGGDVRVIVVADSRIDVVARRSENSQVALNQPVPAGLYADALLLSQHFGEHCDQIPL